MLFSEVNREEFPEGPGNHNSSEVSDQSALALEKESLLKRLADIDVLENESRSKPEEDA